MKLDDLGNDPSDDPGYDPSWVTRPMTQFANCNIKLQGVQNEVGW